METSSFILNKLCFLHLCSTFSGFYSIDRITCHFFYDSWLHTPQWTFIRLEKKKAHACGPAYLPAQNPCSLIDFHIQMFDSIMCESHCRFVLCTFQLETEQLLAAYACKTLVSLPENTSNRIQCIFYGKNGCRSHVSSCLFFITTQISTALDLNGAPGNMC